MNPGWAHVWPSRPAAGGARSRPPDGPRTAFVLSGGGNQGVSQVGMLRALLEREIVPDVVVGTSAGALNGAGICYAPNLTGVAQLSAVWEQLRSDQVFPGGKIHRAWNIVRRGTHLFGSEGLEALIHHSTPARLFSDLQIPLRVIATDLDTGEEVVLVRGPLKPALLASTALPGVFPIVHHDGRRLVDGGVVDNVPLSHAVAGPVDRVFVLNVSSGMSERVERSPLDVVMTSFTHARSQRYELELRHVPPEIEVIELPRPPDRASCSTSRAPATSSTRPTSSPTRRSTERPCRPRPPSNAAASAAAEA